MSDNTLAGLLNRLKVTERALNDSLQDTAEEIMKRWDAIRRKICLHIHSLGYEDVDLVRVPNKRLWHFLIENKGGEYKTKPNVILIPGGDDGFTSRYPDDDEKDPGELYMPLYYPYYDILFRFTQRGSRVTGDGAVNGQIAKILKS